MKHLAYALTALVAIMVCSSLAGCRKNAAQDSAAQLEAMAKSVAVPVKVSDGTMLTACYFTDNTLTYRNETSPDTLAAINIDSLKSVTLRGLLNNVNSRKLVNHLRKARASVRYIYASGPDSVMFSFSPGDLGQAPQ